MTEATRNVSDIDVLFDEDWYLCAYPDVARAVKNGQQKSAKSHYLAHGYREARRPIPPVQKHSISICAILRDEGPYLLEWIAFHLAVGIEHFYIYDNESKDESSTILSQLQRLGFVTKIPWPDNSPVVAESGIGPQVPAYNDFLQYSYETRWVGFIDLDEFVVPTGAINVKDWFAKCKHTAVGINWRMFGSSGLSGIDSRLVIERFTRRAPDDFPPNRHIKTFAIAKNIQIANCHISWMKRDEGVVDIQGGRIDPSRNGIHDRCCSGGLQINHYFTRSRDEWIAKRNRGRATKAAKDKEKYRSLEEFAYYDRNDVVDESALRFADETKKNMAALRQLMRI